MCSQGPLTVCIYTQHEKHCTMNPHYLSTKEQTEMFQHKWSYVSSLPSSRITKGTKGTFSEATSHPTSFTYG